MGIMQEPSHPTSNLIHGCEIISKGLRIDLSPMGNLFRFTGNKSPSVARPKPLTLMKVSSLFVINVLFLIISYLTVKRVFDVKAKDPRVIAMKESAFLNLFGRLVSLYRIFTYLAICIVIVAQHCSIANVIANRNYIIKQVEQSRLAKTAFAVILTRNIFGAGSLMFVVANEYIIEHRTGYGVYLTVIGLFCIFVLNVTIYAPVIYACYLGAALGKHVENFSEIYIDSMFDQFIDATESAEQVDSESARLSSAEELEKIDQQEASDGKTSSWCCYCCCFGRLLKIVKEFFIKLSVRIKTLAVYLNNRKYPELPEMKMTKLSSSTTSIKISDSVRVANSQLIRARLRKTQIMLSELRDMVNDVNKMSSPIIMMLFIMDTMILTMVTTASIQAKLYKSVNVLIIPTVAYTIGIVIIVVYVCTCLDEISSQLKLMTNKLFDFIIMNHRVQQQQQQQQQQQLLSNKNTNQQQQQRQQFEFNLGTNNGFGGDSVEEEALSETWSQFQYTRKLANTIQFTMGGVLTVTRRLALPILGHILSAVFISIEVMSIIDTSGHEESSSNILDATKKVRFVGSS